MLINYRRNYIKTTDDNDLIRRVSLTLEGRSTLLFTFLFYGERQTCADPSRWNLDEYADDNDLKCQVTLILKGRIALQRTFRLHRERRTSQQRGGQTRQVTKKINVSVSIPRIWHHTALTTSVVMLREPCVTRIFRLPDLECNYG